MPSKNVMPKYEKGKLHSGSKHGPIVKSRAQAKAIAASEARAERESGSADSKKTRTARAKRLEDKSI